MKKTYKNKQYSKKGLLLNNNNKQLFTRMYGVAIALILSVLSLSVQAQFTNVPADFDRLLVGEMVLRGTPTTSDCKTETADTCSGVLYVRFESAEINEDAGTGGADQLVVRMAARAGQAAIGRLTIPASCRDSDGR